MRVFCILIGLIVSAVGLLALLAHPSQLIPNATWIAGLALFYIGAFGRQRKTRRIVAGKRQVFVASKAN